VKLQVKLALYNGISKAIIVLAFGLLMPGVIEQVVFNHIDSRLYARSEKMLRMIQRGGLDEISLDQDCSFDNYNIFKEEYVSISPLNELPPDFGKMHIENAERIIEGEVIKHRVLSQAFLYDNQLYGMEIGEGLSSVDALKQTIRRFSIWILVVVIGISIFIDLGFVRLILQPFYRIVNAKLKALRHPSAYNPVPVKTNTYEFAYLDRSIDGMMQQVKDAFLAEREFITNVSHELQTPISILQNRLENIIADPQVDDELKIRMVESQKTLLRLSRIIKALLYISKIENEQFIREDTIDLKATVHDVLAELEDYLADKHIRVQETWDDGYTVHRTNQSLLHTMLFNIVSNAVKYNKSGGDILIRGRRGDKQYTLTVTDTGVGIEKDQLPLIFDRFRRLRPNDAVGYGLGLPIVRTIARYLDVRIEVESVPGSGTTFSLSFLLHEG
jgi:signal transduction histidine kinase